MCIFVILGRAFKASMGNDAPFTAVLINKHSTNQRGHLKCNTTVTYTAVFTIHKHFGLNLYPLLNFRSGIYRPYKV